jgi:hypothetical protein
LRGFEELADQVCTHITTDREGILAVIRESKDVTTSGRFAIWLRAPTGDW